MSGNPRHDSPGAEDDTPGFLSRWSARKCARAEADAEGCEPAGEESYPEQALEPPVEQGTVSETRKVLTDRDMPPLETLNEESDYSGFLSPGVSDVLHRMALRKLFSAAKFQVCDGLDDYDTDYNLLLPLRAVLAEATQDEFMQQLRGLSTAQPDGAERRIDADDTEHEPDMTAESAAADTSEPPQQAAAEKLPPSVRETDQ